MNKLIISIANTQFFKPDDKLGQMIKKYDEDEIALENLDLVYAARKDDTSYAEFLILAKERDNKRK